MARRILNRKDLRADFDAAERQKTEDDVDDTEEEAEDDDEEGEEEEEAAAEGEDESGDDDDEGDEDDEDAPEKKKKKPVKPKAKAKAKPRTRTPKVVRQKVVWTVYNNSHQPVATFDFPKQKEAEDYAAKLTVDKKNTHFVQRVKVAMEEKKE